MAVEHQWPFRRRKKYLSHIRGQKKRRNKRAEWQWNGKERSRREREADAQYGNAVQSYGTKNASSLLQKAPRNRKDSHKTHVKTPSYFKHHPSEPYDHDISHNPPSSKAYTPSPRRPQFHDTHLPHPNHHHHINPTKPPSPPSSNTARKTPDHKPRTSPPQHQASTTPYTPHKPSWHSTH